MPVKKTYSYELTEDNDSSSSFSSIPPTHNNRGEANMNNDKIPNMSDLKLIEERLNSKIDVIKAEMDGKINTAEANLVGKIDSLGNKIDAQNKILWWLMGIISAGIIVPMLALLIRYIF